MSIILIVILLVPIVPYVPICEPRAGHAERIEGVMTPEFREVLKDKFRSFGISYWDLGDVILVRAIPWFTEGQISDYIVAHTGATTRAIWALTSDPYIASSRVGKMVAGKVYRIPAHVEALRNPATGEFDTYSCELMRAVVLGPQGGGE